MLGECGIMGGGRPCSRGSSRSSTCTPAATSSTAAARGWIISSASTLAPPAPGCNLRRACTACVGWCNVLGAEEACTGMRPPLHPMLAYPSE